MSQMYNMQMVFLGSLLCVVFSRAAALPAFSTRSQSLETEGDGPSLNDLDSLKLIFGLTRSTRHADGLFTSGYSKLLGQLSAKDYLESLSKRVNGDLMDSPGKRHSDAVFTDNYSRFRKQMAVKKYLNSVLAGKRSLEDGGLTDVSVRAEPSSQQTTDDVSMEELLNQLTMVL